MWKAPYPGDTDKIFWESKAKLQEKVNEYSSMILNLDLQGQEEACWAEDFLVHKNIDGYFYRIRKDGLGKDSRQFSQVLNFTV